MPLHKKWFRALTKPIKVQFKKQLSLSQWEKQAWLNVGLYVATNTSLDSCQIKKGLSSLVIWLSVRVWTFLLSDFYLVEAWHKFHFFFFSFLLWIFYDSSLAYSNTQKFWYILSNTPFYFNKLAQWIKFL